MPKDSTHPTRESRRSKLPGITPVKIKAFQANPLDDFYVDRATAHIRRGKTADQKIRIWDLWEGRFFSLLKKFRPDNRLF